MTKIDGDHKLDLEFYKVYQWHEYESDRNCRSQEEKLSFIIWIDGINMKVIHINYRFEDICDFGK